MSRAVVFQLLVVLTVSACSAGSMGGDSGGAVGPSGTAGERRNDLETRLACRDRVNQMYDQRERARIYAPQSTLNSPYSANSQIGVTNEGLSDQFAYEQSKADCERVGTGSTEAPAQTPAPPAAKGR